MKNKIFSLALLLSMIVTAGVWAQNLPASIWTSPQSSVTEGRYRSNADDFIRPDAYLGVKFNKWFGLVSFLNDASLGALANVGFATKVGNVYIGAFYNGNLWANAPVNNYVEREFVTAPAGGVDGRIYNVYNNISVVPSPINNIALLIGLADMGFRITYRTNHQSFDEGGIVIGNQLYSSYKTEGGYMAPQIAWAMAKDLTSKGIRPYLTVDLVFNYDYRKIATSGPDGSGNTGTVVGYSLNHFDPSFAAGLGGYTVYNKDGFKLSCDLDYVLTLNTYDNEYSDVEGTVYKTCKIKGTYSPGSFPYNERSFMSNSITPSLSGSWSQDRLALKFKLNLPLTFTSSEQNGMALYNGSLVYNNSSDSTFAFTFRPDVRLALQYKIIPDKLTLNTGARIQATTISLETTDRVNYSNGTRISSQKIHNDSYSGINNSFVSRFSVGPTFNFTQNAWVEASTGVSNVFGDGAIDIFAPGGLFSFGSILVALKF